MDNNLQVSNLSYDKNKITDIKMFEVGKKWRRYAFEIIMPSLVVVLEKLLFTPEELLM